MVGILVSFWDGIFSGAMLVSGSVMEHDPLSFYLATQHPHGVKEIGHSQSLVTGSDLCIFRASLHELDTDLLRHIVDIATEISLSNKDIQSLDTGSNYIWVFPKIMVPPNHPF